MICLEDYSAQPAKFRKSWINAYDSWFKKSPHNSNQYCPSSRLGESCTPGLEWLYKLRECAWCPI
jgi:hypothetical protein